MEMVDANSIQGAPHHIGAQRRPARGNLREERKMKLIEGRMLGYFGPMILLGFGQLAIAPPADARITRLEIVSTQSPTFGALSFGSVGQYEKIFATAYGEIDPTDRRNALITDINLAP